MSALTKVNRKKVKSVCQAKKRQKIKMFDNWAKWYADFYKGEQLEDIQRKEDRQSMHRFRMFLEAISNHRKYRIVDVGCGTGYLLVRLLQLGHDAYGFDYSDNMIRQAKDFLKKSDLNAERAVCADLSFLDRFRSNSLDFVTAAGLVRYLNREEERKFYRKVRRVLKPSGRFVVTFTNELFDVWSFNRYTVDFFKRNVLTFKPIEQYVDPEKAVSRFRQLITHPEEPVVRAHSLRDKNLVILHNPLTIEKHLLSYGFEVKDKRFSLWEPMPPLLKDGDEKSYDLAHAALEMYDDHDWRGNFMAYEIFTNCKPRRQ
ncbi:MAG: methyltransferase domain-containing protein [Candidatus Omnitrophica bacterium]|nr:methyltransferase domain-containing protein [Candidatus Omnitrophota bacterium]